MQGWLDAGPYVKTKYSLLLHNDGYALDSFFGCELLQALKARQQSEPNAGYALAAAGPVIALVGCFFYARARSPPTTVTGGQFAIEEDRS